MATPKWEAEARDRLKKALRRFNKPLAELEARDANEGDTRLLVTDLLCDGLGFDKYEDLTTEYQVRGEFADYGIRVKKQLVAFIEVKRVAQKLHERHLRQVQNYAVNEGVAWMILTNGRIWRVYHLTGGLPVEVDLVEEVDLLGEDSNAEKAAAMFYLTREAMQRDLLEELWRARSATSPKVLAGILQTPEMIDQIRKAVRRETKHNADANKIAQVLADQVIRPELTQ